MLIRCSRCGAPLDVAAGARRAKCAYCGATSRVASTQTLAAVTPPNWQPPKVWTPPPDAGLPAELHRRASRRISVAALLGTLFTAALGLIPLFASGALSLPFVGKAARWDGTETLTCGVNETLEIEGLTMPPDAPAPPVSIEATGPNCRVVLRDVTLHGETLVRAGINTRVEIERARLEATTVVEGNTNTAVVLRDVRARARARVVDGGLNTAVDVRGESKLAAGTTALVLGLNGRVTLDGPVVIEAERDAIVAESNLELRSRQAVVISRDGAAIRAGSNPRIRLDGGRVEGRPALQLPQRADVERLDVEVVSR